MGTRPSPYNPARRCIPWWWTWGGIWIDGTRYATWPQARANFRKKRRKAPMRAMGTE